MTEDNKTILANLAITIAEKEASIQRLTNRINELVYQCNALNNERHGAEMVVTPQQRTTLGEMFKDGMLKFKSYEELEDELLDAKAEVEHLGNIITEQDAKITDLRTARDSERWFQLLKATHRKLKRAQRAIKYHHRTTKMVHGNIIEQNHNLSNAYQDIKRDYDSMRIRMEKAEKKLNDITDNIDKFVECRRRLAEDKDVLLTLSQQTQINEKNKLIEQLKKENEELKAKLYDKQ